MRRITSPVGALFFLAAACAPAAAQFPIDLSGFSWRTDLDAARKEALEKGSPLLIVFR